MRLEGAGENVTSCEPFEGYSLNVLVVSPHRDDASFSLTLAIRSWLLLDHRVTVMNCFTRSNYAPFADLSHVHPNDTIDFVSALRFREDEAWRRLQRSDSLNFHDLRLKDAPIRLRCPLDEICTRKANPSNPAFARIEKAMQLLDTTAAVLPLALGGHVDHGSARDAAWSVVANGPVAFYEDLPYAAGSSVTPAIESFVADLELAFGVRLVATSAGGKSDVDPVKIKQRAALCYDSQINDETADTIAQFCLRYQGSERLWVNPAWLALEPALTQVLAGQVNE